MNLTTVQNALKIILNNTENFGVEEIDFLESEGRVLKENIIADRDFPPFNRVSMDGIAIDIEAFNKGQASFKIEGIQAAGSPQLTLKDSNNCMEAMTGAVLPKNTNAVIQYELLTIENGVATLNVEDLKHFQNIHKKGLDRKQEAILISKNTQITSAEIGVLATVGKFTVKVAKLPKVMVISTGNELVEVNETPEEHQIRRSNVYTLVSILKQLGISAKTAHILDDKEVLKTKIDGFLNDYDVLIFSGAVSKGKFDFIPEVLNDLGVEKLFHRVKQRPGKPFWFGKKGEKTIFAFPGNPVSTFVSCLKYFTPWFKKSVGVNFENKETAILAENFSFKPSLTYFLQVKTNIENGKKYAITVSGKGSGDLANLVDADAFLELPDNRTNFTKGEVFPLINYR
ncbi:molybdopterin molybdotransferase MoeA [Lutibacter sp. TH_r2]|uniref:molybdopterin molybdotransferase MoeA n=1 Tax=Lutibacter sp. TH_r2 TaxID=3082083 RepID=UPI002955617A|nr:molybdopterin molybdotransferase MoeA [Lutibacter sp. TH_r2]MDV7186263.1 molybdopterin molybdotransferase MoeA [Lutibacter sp. TH_r2]